uniref:Uncharacterized protein n=1 Tax=viral metagenome TaxID=1070528 RepID=A0A6C0I5C3_9ZZZZ
MAYCFLDISGEQIVSILDWNVVNLMTDGLSIVNPCLCSVKSSKKKKNVVVDISCNKPAKYTKNDQYYCDKHAKKDTTYLLPSKMTTSTYLATKKVDDLFKLAISLQLYSDSTTTTITARPKKTDLLTKLNEYYATHCYQLLASTKQNAGTGKAGDIDLIELGKNMRTLFDQNAGWADATHIIIENQISTLASRMKTIQGMLAQYFIMRNPEAHIVFVSSANKLKGLTREPLENTLTPAPMTITAGQRYREHKRDSVFHCSHILRQHSHLEMWQSSLLTKKKDDLADCFLQGVWYTKQNVLR